MIKRGDIVRPEHMYHLRSMENLNRNVTELYVELALLKNGQVTDNLANMIISNFHDLTKVTMTQGIYDSTNKKIYIK